MLRVENVSVSFESDNGLITHALENINLDIADEALVVALGTSGCGKSTLLNAMAGFLPVSSGRIMLDDQVITAPGAERGVVFQKDTLLPWKSVVENVALGLKFAGHSRQQRRKRGLELLALVGLEDFADTAPYNLSGGMRQRVGIARALATDPSILLMDEPFGALDSMTREQMQELLVRVWARTRKQIFLITHSIEEALFLATEVVVMSPRPGRIIKRYHVDFVQQFLRTGQAAAVKSSPEFLALREEIRGIIHQPEYGDRRAA